MTNDLNRQIELTTWVVDPLAHDMTNDLNRQIELTTLGGLAHGEA